jgi:5-methylthioadenosine/S-adenosylhomocysteine deaminase
MDAVTALDLATRAGARALGLDDVGVLEVGAWADLIRVDLHHPAFVPRQDLITRLVFAGSSRFVTDVWVAGRRVVDEQAVTTVDLGRAMDEVDRRARRLAEG